MDLISRADVEQTVEDNILCYTHSDRPIDQDHDIECHMAIRTALRMLRKDLRKLPSAQPEPCEDAVSRRRLLSDLKELTAAWGKYPVMEEQIKGVETAIGYVETIPSVTPERKKGKWIKLYRGTIAEGLHCSVCGKHGYRSDFCPNCGADMMGERDGEN